MQPKDLGYLTGLQFDFPQSAVCSKSYIVASSERSGSTLLAMLLWQTGFLGAPWEYLNFDSEMRFMVARLQPESIGDYIRTVIACRTSPNGVFGLKAHYHHFIGVLREFPDLLRAMPLLRFVVIERDDKVAQAVSLARAIQTNAWSSYAIPSRIPEYDRALIEQCLRKVQLQVDGWSQWLEQSRQTPRVVHYEDLVRDPATVTADVIAFIDPPGQGDAPVIELPMVERQADAVSAEWAQRFRTGT